MVELETTNQTKKEIKKQWNKMKTNVFFYCRGAEKDSEDRYDDYAYIGKVTGVDTDDIDGTDNTWLCVDIWNLHDEDAQDHEWAASQEVCMTHDVFIIIDPEDYPEYFL